MESADPTHRSPLQFALGAYAAAFTAAGLLVPIPLLMAHGLPTHRQLLLASCLAIVAMISDRLTIEFQFSGRQIGVTPDVVAWVLAAVLLPPWLAMGVALGSIPSGWGEQKLRRIMLNAGALAAALGATSAIVHGLLPSPHGDQLLLAGLLGAVIFECCYVSEGLAYMESRERGAALEHVRESAEVSGFEIALPTVGVAVVGPFADRPLVAGMVLAAFQIVTFLGLRVMKSEQVHRTRSTFLKDAFSRFVPATVVDELTEERAELTLGGEQIDVTVLFCDVRDFTTWSEQLEPKEIVSQLNELMAELMEAVFETDGTLDKYTGDGLMAFWGAPLPQTDHPRRAHAAALRMLQRVDALNDRRADVGRPPFRVGIGIHSGPAVVGNLGHIERMNYTAIGDTVNVAARLEAATKEAGCALIVSADTRVQLADDVALHPIGRIPVKGRVGAVDAYASAQPLARPADTTTRLHDAA